jgi:hypothetical protein
VLKLRKALYELHQAPRAWNAKLDDMLLSLGFWRTSLERQRIAGGRDLHR